MESAKLYVIGLRRQDNPPARKQAFAYISRDSIFPMGKPTFQET